MRLLCYFAFLCSLSFSSPSLPPIKCNATQYAWPVDKPKFCCNKCPPGEYLVRRFVNCQTECKPCEGKRYTDTYNVEMTCNFCANCERLNMEYKSHCSPTHNAVCKCKAGYECRDQPCSQCVPVSSTTQPTLPPSTTALITPTTLWAPQKPLRGKDAVWLIIGLLSAVIAFAVGTKIHLLLRWIKSKHGYFLPKAHESEDEEVSKPVQEAGNVTNLKTDPELGLARNLQANI
ncbi:CD27 antigen-like [Chaetodon trifascialis]|uniref:CD27 antigen-like n=1 Tax=Chaetodon trifascialis TaxID=109706 RepID=UPI0039911956